MNPASVQEPSDPESRRRKGLELLARGLPQAEVARQCNVTRQTAMRWSRRLTEGDAGWRDRRPGRPAALNADDLKRLSEMISHGAAVNPFPDGRWTLARVVRLIEREFGRRFSQSTVWHLLRIAGVRRNG